MTGSIFLLGMFAVSIVSLAVRSIAEEDRAARKDAVAEAGGPGAEAANGRGARATGA